MSVAKTCEIWTGATGNSGYGHRYLNGRFTTAHRWAYLKYVGPIPDGYVIDHICNNKLCVNIDHLQAITQSENIRRAFPMCRKKLHEWTPENTGMSGGRRYCRACNRIYQSVLWRRHHGGA